MNINIDELVNNVTRIVARRLAVVVQEILENVGVIIRGILRERGVVAGNAE